VRETLKALRPATPADTGFVMAPRPSATRPAASFFSQCYKRQDRSLRRAGLGARPRALDAIRGGARPDRAGRCWRDWDGAGYTERGIGGPGRRHGPNTACEGHNRPVRGMIR